MSDTVCVHFVKINSALQKVYIVKAVYTNFIQNVYK